jgi:hypothetical protein
MGWLWLNATTALLRAGPEAGTMFFSLSVAMMVLSRPVIFQAPKFSF